MWQLAKIVPPVDMEKDIHIPEEEKIKHFSFVGNFLWIKCQEPLSGIYGFCYIENAMFSHLYNSFYGYYHFPEHCRVFSTKVLECFNIFREDHEVIPQKAEDWEQYNIQPVPPELIELGLLSK